MFYIKNQEIFQGEKDLEKHREYFEGWYFKHLNQEDGFSVIPGISVQDGKKEAFIQVITKDISQYIPYDFNSFKYASFPFSVQIGDSVFSKEKVVLNIKSKNLNINGELRYAEQEEIKKSMWSPNIMGPFSYIPFMECNHAIISMKHRVDGQININDEVLKFDGIGKGYIEKDWGTSFPKTYMWCQSNNFKKAKASLFFSVADIPFKVFNFRGHICVFKIGDKEYRFATYNNSKIKRFEVNENKAIVDIKKGKYELEIECVGEDRLKLIAPVKGGMTKNIKETINASLKLTLKENNKVIFEGESNNSGLEIVKEEN